MDPIFVMETVIPLKFRHNSFFKFAMRSGGKQKAYWLEQRVQT